MAIDLYKNRCSVYDGDKPYIFISYSHDDIDRVVTLIRKLQSLGFRIWYDSGVPAGTEWREVIATKLKNCKCVLALLSKNSTQSRDFKLELNYAYHLELPILVAYLDKCKPTPGVEMLVVSQQCIKQEFCEDDDDLLNEIARAQILAPCRDEKPDMTPPELPAPAPAPEEDDSDPEAQIEELRRRAEAGDPGAQFELAFEYEETNNHIEAVEWYRRAAEQGHARAQLRLGFCYDFGRGIERNQEAAFEWFQKSAEQGYPVSQAMVGLCYEYGTGVAQNWDEAVRWYRKAAEQDHALSQEKLAKCYREGLGVPIDLEEANYWQKRYNKNPDK